jgi:hypothetical protein
MVPHSYFASGFLFGVAVGVRSSMIFWLWVRLARAAGAVANRRGYPRLVGVVAGILTGPLALAACALLPSRPGVQQREVVALSAV